MCAVEHPILTNILLLMVPLGTRWRLVLFFCLYFIFLFYGAVGWGFSVSCLKGWFWGSMDYGTAPLRAASCFCFQFLRSF